jgi:hypothetical protein
VRNRAPGTDVRLVMNATTRRARALVVSFCLLGCGDDEDPKGAKDLLQRVRDDDYKSWQRAPGYETRQESNAPHSDAVDIYVNDVIADALAAAEPLEEWPVGSIIVKEGFSDGEREVIALMEKESTGWFWAEFFGSDSKYSGTPEICIDCHERGDDHVRAFNLP